MRTYSMFDTVSAVYDAGSGFDCLTLQELKGAFETIAGGIHVAVFDACHMNSLEAGYQFRDIIGVSVAAAGLVPAKGFPLTYMEDLPEKISPADLALRVAAAAREGDCPADARVVVPSRVHPIVDAVNEVLHVAVTSNKGLFGVFEEGTGLGKYISGVDAYAHLTALLAPPSRDKPAKVGQQRYADLPDASKPEGLHPALSTLRQAIVDYQIGSDRSPDGLALYYPIFETGRYVTPLMRYYATLDINEVCEWGAFVLCVKLSVQKL